MLHARNYPQFNTRTPELGFRNWGFSERRLSGLGFLFRGFKSKLMLYVRLGFDDLTPENRSAEGILRNRISELDLGTDLLHRRVIRVRRLTSGHGLSKTCRKVDGSVVGFGKFRERTAVVFEDCQLRSCLRRERGRGN